MIIVSTLCFAKAALMILPATSSPSAHTIPVFKPSLAAAIEEFTASPPTCKLPDRAVLFAVLSPLIMESIRAIPAQIRSYILFISY